MQTTMSGNLAKLAADHHKAMTTATQVRGYANSSPKAQDAWMDKATTTGESLYEALTEAGLAGVSVSGFLYTNERTSVFPTTDSGGSVNVLDLSKILAL